MLKAQVITDAVAGGRPMGSGDKQVAEAIGRWVLDFQKAW